jgi:prepilin-type N-terminal cleavage/methylation domain-containing protein
MTALRRARGQAARAARDSGSGFTLVEMLLSLAILAVIAATVAGMLATLSTGTRSATELRQRNVRAEVVRERIESTVRSSARVLAAGDGWLVLWAGDVRTNDAPDLSEVCRVEWDKATSELRYFAPPPALPDADNVKYAFTSDFDAITRSLAGTAKFPGQVWGRRVQEWKPSVDGTAGTARRTVSYRLTLQDEQGLTTFVATVAPRGA